ncbi:hypothetical protein [Noviherbaspirillum humi]|uniref:hypothetical protein n=1 Tax=Noviherbaspirillum humi TaxID=1688639 RepID=UPI000B788656|nr:hypothetical protein [Noviherbaspirillum humi]
MHLEEHLKQTGQTQGDFGKRLIPPASQGLVSQWIRGVTRVTLHYAVQIEDLTGGAVMPQDCADMYIDPRNRASAASDSMPPNKANHLNRRHDDPNTEASATGLERAQ